MPDAGAACGMGFVNGSAGRFDGFSIVGGHEYEEAQTDPFPSSGWLDRFGSENADKCAWNSLSTNITLGSSYFAVQPIWSNKAGGCVKPV
jgi:serine protease